MLFGQIKRIAHDILFSELPSEYKNINQNEYSEKLIMFAIDESYSHFLFKTDDIESFINMLNTYNFDYRIHNSDININKNDVSLMQVCNMYDLPEIISNGMLYYIKENLYMYNLIDNNLMELDKVCDNFSDFLNQKNIYDVLIIKTSLTSFRENVKYFITS